MDADLYIAGEDKASPLPAGRQARSRSCNREGGLAVNVGSALVLTFEKWNLLQLSG